MEIKFVDVELKRMDWSRKVFTEATSESSLIKAEGEIQEIRENHEKGIRDPEEYCDAIMCLFDSAAREGIPAREILETYAKKVEININRKWKKNPDNTYSHVKE
jgi:maltooligosyltrehalose synthase